jgi:hypothetical protein
MLEINFVTKEFRIVQTYCGKKRIGDNKYVCKASLQEGSRKYFNFFLNWIFVAHGTYSLKIA